MNACERCTENHRCAWQNHDETICRDAPAFPLTNADRIRQMSDAELASCFADFETRCYLRLEPTADCDTVNFAKQLLEWLKAPVEADE